MPDGHYLRFYMRKPGKTNHEIRLAVGKDLSPSWIDRGRES